MAEHRPDVVVTDLSMPGLDGVEATRLLLKEQPGLAVLVLTMHEDDEHVFAALRAGARGYLVKGAGGEEIVRAVVSVASGDAVYGGPVARRIVAFFAGEGDQSPSVRAFPDLTPREREVLDLLAIGCRNHEIARRLTMSDKTVRNHVSQVLLKLQRARPHRRGPEGPGGRPRHAPQSLTAHGREAASCARAAAAPSTTGSP